MICLSRSNSMRRASWLKRRQKMSRCVSVIVVTMLRVLKRLENDIMGDEAQRRALAEITADIDNIRLSWGRAAGRGDLETLEKSRKSLWAYYLIRGWYQEGDEAFQKAVVGIIDTYGEVDELAGESKRYWDRSWCGRAGSVGT